MCFVSYCNVYHEFYLQFIVCSWLLVTCDMNWRSLEDGRKIAQHVMMYKRANKNVAITKQNRPKPPLIQSQNIHSSTFIIPPCETQQRHKSFFPRRIFNWNMLLQPIVLSGSVETFKAVVSSIKYVFNLFQLSYVSFDIIVNLLKWISIC